MVNVDRIINKYFPNSNIPHLPCFRHDHFGYNDHLCSCGQGIAYQLIREWFKEIKKKNEIFINRIRFYFIIFLRVVLKRKTCKSTTQPIRFKGWKGKR